MIPTQPDFLEMPFAANGGKNTIATSGGEDEGNATLDQGFPMITEQPLSQGGIPPRRKDFNGILYALSNFQFFAQSGGVYTYDAGLDYRTPAIVWYGDNLYICVKNNGPSTTVVTPNTNSDYWKDFIEFLGLGTDGNIVASKLGTSTVGSGTKHIYLNAGSPVASSSTVGGTAQGVWLNAGTMTAMSATVGSSSNGIYMDNGVLKACSGSSSASAQVIDTYHSGASWYRKWSDGFIEQGGVTSIASGGTTVSLHTAMTSTNYTVNMTKQSSSVTKYSADAYYCSRTTTSFIGMCCRQGGSASWDSFTCSWVVRGY